MDANQLKAKLQGNAIIRAALEAGDIRIIYKRKPSLSDDLLFGTWTVEVLLVDPEIRPLAVKALEDLGFDVSDQGSKLVCEYTFPITPAQRRAMEQKEQDRKDRAREKKHRDEFDGLQSAVAQLREEFASKLQELQEEIELQGLLPNKPKQGPPGPAGKDGRDGKDAEGADIQLQELADVSKIPAGNGQVLMWSDMAQEWQPKHVSSGIASISGGGGGGGGGVKPENPGPGGPEGGTNNGWLPKWWYESETGDWMPRTKAQNIGSADFPVQELFVSSGSIIMDGHTIALGDTSGGKRLTYDGNVLAYELFTDQGEPIEPIGDAPRDGYSYVRKDGKWVRLIDELLQLGFEPGEPLDGVDGGLWSELICGYKADGGDMNDGADTDGVQATVDGGDMNTGSADDLADGIWDGGNLN